MSCQLHFGKIPLPNGLEEAVIADVRVLLCGGERVAASWQAVTTRGLCWGGLGFNKAVHRRVLQGKKWRSATSFDLHRHQYYLSSFVAHFQTDHFATQAEHTEAMQYC